MIKNKKYIIFILVIVCIVAFSFLNKATVFDSIIAVGLSVQIEQEKIYYTIDYLSKEEKGILSVEAKDLDDLKTRVKNKTGKSISFAHCVVFIIQKNQDMFTLLKDICSEKTIDYNALIFVCLSPKEILSEEILEKESVSLFIEKSRKEDKDKITLKDFLIAKQNKTSIALEEIAIEEKLLESKGEFVLKCY